MNRIVLFFSYVIAIVLLVLPVICSSQAKEPFSLTVAVPEEPLKAGEELHLRVTVKNTSDSEIILARSPGPIPREEGFRYQIDIRDEQGHTPPPSAYILSLKDKTTFSQSSNLSGKLAPGESFVEQVTVTRFFDLSHPGKYAVTLTRPIEPWQHLGKGNIKSNTVAVTITP